MKKKVLIIVIVLIGLAFTLCGPYNILQDFNANEILQDVQLKRDFHNDPLRSAEYKGRDTYIVYTDSGDEFVVIKDYFSVMNFKWKIYELRGGVEDE
ncbi:hypothetical protein D3H55_21390 [Bacillus salacetis]|uniref:DUF3139 domain-containing protein n=1 Tax=Bacillus salacetis TaxID=2315464 RepID=A0A3A1QNF9_9BACI|nr:hypothetical protein [Bacillus salacetis]RIW28619.1 hypothetical protein D3H55_21390 [Bacillus salacetis]